MSPTLYDVLGVSPAASSGELRRAYMAEARRHHPDAGGNADVMRELNQAWAVLSDPVRRRSYDLELGITGIGDRPAWSGPSEPYDGDRFAPLDVDPADLLDDRPISLPPRSGALPLIPPALFLLSVGLGSVALVLDSPPMLGFAALVFLLSCVSVAAVAMWMLRSTIRR